MRRSFFYCILLLMFIVVFCCFTPFLARVSNYAFLIKNTRLEKQHELTMYYFSLECVIYHWMIWRRSNILLLSSCIIFFPFVLMKTPNQQKEGEFNYFLLLNYFCSFCVLFVFVYSLFVFRR